MNESSPATAVSDRGSNQGACLTHARLLRTTRNGSFLRSFPLHSPRYARETIAETCSLGVALATAIMSQTGSRDITAIRRPKMTGTLPEFLPTATMFQELA
jgi:hypothetical protein